MNDAAVSDPKGDQAMLAGQFLKWLWNDRLWRKAVVRRNADRQLNVTKKQFAGSRSMNMRFDDAEAAGRANRSLAKSILI